MIPVNSRLPTQVCLLIENDGVREKVWSQVFRSLKSNLYLVMGMDMRDIIYDKLKEKKQ